jgi:anaerobic magnesium-protoporphyrin IX monomethyl ester cyclase
MSKIKVLLVNPPAKAKGPPYNIPLGLAYIAAVIDSKGHDVAIFDNNAYRLNDEEVLDQLRGETWDIIGIGALVTTYVWQKRIFKLLRKEFPDTLLIAGGGLATSLKQNLMQWVPEIDILCVGEGERTIGEILANFDERSWGNVRGIYYRQEDKICATLPQPLLSPEELSQLPFPKYDLLPLDEVYFKYSGIPLSPEAMVAKRRLTIEASRGCPFSCSFCIDLPSGTSRTKFRAPPGGPSAKIRYYSPKWVVSLIKYLRLKYAVDFLNFTDECFTASKKYVMEFCDLMEQEGLADLDPSLYFGVTAHVNTLNKDMLNRLRKVGCSHLDLGIESMNADILSKAMKGSTPARNEWAVNECLKAGIYPITNFMIGFPEDTVQSLYDDVKFWIKHDITIGPFFATPYPGTELFEKCKDKILAQCGGSLENFVIKCEIDPSTTFVVNLTKYSDDELLELRQIMMNRDLDRLKKFAEQKGEKIVETEKDPT